MTKTLQIRIDDETKIAVDDLYADLGLDTSTAVRMFFAASLQSNGLPFPVVRREFNAETVEALQAARKRRNLLGPYKSAKAMLAAALKD